MTITFEYPSKQQVEFIYDNIREHDKVELSAFNISRENVFEQLSTCDETMCGLVDGVPVAILGYTKTPKTIRFNFFSTNECDKHWKFITKCSKSYVKFIISMFPNHRPIIEVWEQHTNSLRWLKLLGFERTKAYRYTKYGKMVFVEFNKYRNNKGE